MVFLNYKTVKAEQGDDFSIEVNAEEHSCKIANKQDIIIRDIEGKVYNK